MRRWISPPWLAGNLDLLGKAVDLKLEVVRPEAQVGPFSLANFRWLHRSLGQGVTRWCWDHPSAVAPLFAS